MPLHLGSDIGNKMNCWACREIWYGEKWDEFRHSWHSATPDLGLSRYRRISWHWFQGLRHDSYLDINFFIITFDECQEILKWWYLGNYLGWDLETSVSLRADIDIMPKPGLSNDMNHKYHLNFHHIRSAQSNRQLSKSPYSQCLSPGVMASMEAATSIYLGSNQQPDQNGQFSCSNHQISNPRRASCSLSAASQYFINHINLIGCR